MGGPLSDTLSARLSANVVNASGSVLVDTTVSLISAGTERSIVTPSFER